MKVPHPPTREKKNPRRNNQNGKEVLRATTRHFCTSHQHHSPPWKMIFNLESNTQLTKSSVGIEKRHFQTHTRAQNIHLRKLQRNILWQTSQQLIVPSSFLEEVISSSFPSNSEGCPTPSWGEDQSRSKRNLFPLQPLGSTRLHGDPPKQLRHLVLNDNMADWTNQLETCPLWTSTYLRQSCPHCLRPLKIATVTDAPTTQLKHAWDPGNKWSNRGTKPQKWQPKEAQDGRCTTGRSAPVLMRAEQTVPGDKLTDYQTSLGNYKIAFAAFYWSVS